MARPALWIVLFISLALNVFVAGAFVGQRLVRPPAAPALAEATRPEGRLRNPIGQAVRTLSPRSQAAWRDQGEDFVRTMGPRGQEARRLARETMRGFGAEPFDPEAAAANLAKARALELENRTAMDQRLVAFAASLPAEERVRFAEALARPQPPRPVRD